MARSRSLYIYFESVVAEIFREEGFSVERNVRIRDGRTDFEVDIKLVSKTGVTSVVDVKLFRTLTLAADVITQLVDRVNSMRMHTRSDRGVLVTSARIPPALRYAAVSDNPRIVIYDQDALRQIAARHATISARLEEIFRESMINMDTVPTQTGSLTASTSILSSEPQIADQAPERLESADAPPIGGALCEALRGTKSGRRYYRAFETAIEDALRYIFATDLVSWSRQKITDAGLSRYDLIARVSSSDDVWRMVRERFHSQYVIFECKNYSDPIRQGEVYTTEKYLFLRALRSVAFIISRNGAHESALAASRGALRENGKLIVNLSMDDICALLALKDGAQDYNGFLFDKIDDMLMKLER
jgi:restriction endonuclease